MANGPLRADKNIVDYRGVLFGWRDLVGLGAGRLQLHCGPRHRRIGHRHFHGRRSALHLGDRAAEISWASGGDVPVQHCVRNFGGISVQLPARQQRTQRLAVDAGSRGFPIAGLCDPLLRVAGKPALVVDSPGRSAGALSVLRMIEPAASPQETEAAADAIVEASQKQTASAGIWSGKLRRPILLAFLIAFFNQLSGINAILYFAPRIFKLAGLADKAAFLQSVGIGVTNLIFTFVGLWLIDRLGRRTLLFIGSFGYILSLGLVSWAFFQEHYAIVPACIFAFIAAHAIGQGAVIWVFISEIFPNRQRAEGQALGSFTHWIFAALLTTFFPRMVASFAPGSVFAFFAFMMILQLIWVKTMVPE